MNWPKLMMQSIWSVVAMNSAKDVVPPCKLQAATTAAISACDAIDGVTDGVIEDPDRCNSDAKTLVGKPAGTCGTFTEADADIIKKLWEGPERADGTRVWHGQTLGRRLHGPGCKPGRAGGAVHLHGGFDSLLADAESAIRCDQTDPGSLRAFLGSIPGAVRDCDRHGQSGFDGVPGARRQDRECGMAGRIS